MEKFDRMLSHTIPHRDQIRQENQPGRRCGILFPIHSNLLVPEPLNHTGLQSIVPHHFRARRPRGPLLDMELHPFQIRPERIRKYSGNYQELLKPHVGSVPVVLEFYGFDGLF